MAECRLTSTPHPPHASSWNHARQATAAIPYREFLYDKLRSTRPDLTAQSLPLCRATLRLTAFTTPRSPFFDPSPNEKLQWDGKAWNRPIPVSPRQALALHGTTRLKDITSLTLVYDPAMAPMPLPQFASFITAALLEGQWRTRRCLSHPEKPRGRIRSPSLDI